MSEYPPGYTEPASVDDVWDKVIEANFEARERHRELMLQVRVIHLTLLLALGAILYKLYF